MKCDYCDLDLKIKMILSKMKDDFVLQIICNKVENLNHKTLCLDKLRYFTLIVNYQIEVNG